MSIYKSFPQANLIRDWDKLIKLPREEVVQLQAEWEVIHQENNETHHRMFEERTNKLNEIATYLKSNGIDVFKYKKKGFFSEKSGYQAWFKTNVADKVTEQYPSYQRSIPTATMGDMTVDGVRLYNNVSPSRIVELYDRLTWQYNKEIKEVLKTDKLLVKSIEYATKHNIDIEYLTPKEIISVVADEAKKEYLNENVPVGSKVPLKHECDNCDTYIMGDHRCSCGNRRIGIVVEGDLIEGFYHYPEGC